jgi:hypothetical protein
MVAFRCAFGLYGVTLFACAFWAIFTRDLGLLGLLVFLILGAVGAFSFGGAVIGRRATFPLVMLSAILLPFYGVEFLRGMGSDLLERWEYDRRSKLEVILHFRKQGTDAVAAIYPELFLRDPLVVSAEPVIPLGGIPHIKTVNCNEVMGWQSYQSDRYGFPNPDHSWNFETHVVLVGDSFTQGDCVPEDLSFAGLLRRDYPGVVNLGRGGNGPLLELASIVEYLQVLHPKVVFWFYYDGNDVYRRTRRDRLPDDLAREKHNPILRNYLENESYQQGLLERQDAIAEALIRYFDQEMHRQISRRMTSVPPFGVPPLGELSEFLMLQTTIRKIRETLSYFGVLPPSSEFLPLIPLESREVILQDASESLLTLRKILRLAKEKTEDAGARFVFVYLPSAENFVFQSQHPLKDSILRILSDLDIELIDAETAMAPYDAQSLYAGRSGGHFNLSGHKFINDLLLINIKKEL